MASFPLLLFFTFLFTATPLHSASNNKLITKKFRWLVTQTKHFDIHYYPGAERILPSVAEELEKSYARVTGALKIEIPKRAPFFLFLTHNDFEQNNIVEVGEGTGGVTEAFKNRFLIFNDGTQKWLKHVIVHEFTHVSQFHVLYSGFWKSVKLLKSVLYPLWLMEGMAEYFSGELDKTEKEMVLRDAITSKNFIPLARLHGFNHVKPHQVTLAYKTGNATIDYIAKEYGEEKIGELLATIAEKFDVNSTLQEVLGINLAQLDAKVQEELEEKYEDAKELKEPKSYGEALTSPDQLYPVFHSHPTYLPDGQGFFYLSDKVGYTEIFRYDLALRRPMAMQIQKKFPSLLENVHRSGSALSVSSDGRWLLFAGEAKQKDYLYLFDLKRERLKRIALPLDGVHSPQFSPDGKTIAFIGMKNGITDIYLCTTDGKELRQMTETIEDENDLRFFPDGKNLLFSREENLPVPERNLWQISLENKQETKLTQLHGDEVQPAVAPSGKEILFVSDTDGIPNLYLLSLGTKQPRQLTRVVGGNFYPAFSPNGEEILFVSYRRVEQHLYRTSKQAFLSAEKSAAAADAGKQKAVPSEIAPSPEQTALHRTRPYSLRASTDFFFPVMFYSSTDGLYLSAFWQASEMLGNHQIQAAVTYASAFNFLNYQIFYSYVRFRPQFIFGFLGDTQQNVLVSLREERREDAQFVGMIYPLSRFDRIQFRFLTTQRKIFHTDDPFVTLRPAGRDNVASFSFSRDVAQGRYLETTSGYRFALSYEESNQTLESEQDYRNLFLTLHQFLPLHKESSMALRIFSGASTGKNRQVFRAGGADLLRGYSRFDASVSGSNFLITNFEFRFPLWFNLDYHLWFLFPDLLFKNIYGAVFSDTGLVGNAHDQLKNYTLSDLKNSVGLGIRFQTFILQTFPMILQLDWARRSSDGEHTFYLSLGPHF